MSVTAVCVVAGSASGLHSRAHFTWAMATEEVEGAVAAGDKARGVSRRRLEAGGGGSGGEVRP
jgi:hypothetical protein